MGALAREGAGGPKPKDQSLGSFIMERMQARKERKASQQQPSTPEQMRKPKKPDEGRMASSLLATTDMKKKVLLGV